MQVRKGFHPGRVLREGENGKEKLMYRVRFEKALAGVLAVCTVLFILSKRMSDRVYIPEYVFSDSLVLSELTPATRQGGMLRPPVLPQIPVVSEDEYLSEDVTIDIVDFTHVEGVFDFDGVGPAGSLTGGGFSGPRPVREVVPEYPDDLRKRGIKGVVTLSIRVNTLGEVDSVIVVRNTTGNMRLARAAVAAAYKTRYQPLGRADEKSFWIERPTRFEGN